MDGKETQTDVTLGTEGTETPPKTYTEKEVEKRVLDARTAVMADATRAKKAAEDALNRVSLMMKEQEEKELESYKDDTEGLRRIRAEQRARQLASELDQERKARTELEDKQKQIDADMVESTKERNAREIATRLGVDVNRLIKLAKFTDGTTESIEDIAKELNPPKPIKPDSGRTTGSGLSDEQIREAYRNNPRDPTVKADYLAWRRSKGI